MARKRKRDIRKVFLCSTSYDLLDARAEADDFIRRMGYEQICYEDADFFDKPDVSRHDQCVEKVNDADALVILIDRRYGANYLGSKYYRGENISITWAEARRAIERNIPVAWFVRDKTWAERNLIKKNKNTGQDVSPAWMDKKDLVFFIDYLQQQQRLTMYEFKDSTELKQKLGQWLDAVSKRVSYSLINAFNSSFISVTGIEPLLKKLYSVHRGQIWLFNNDLDLIKSSALFKAIYVDVLLPKLDRGVVESIKIVLRPEKYLEFFDPRESGRVQLLKNFSMLGEHINKIHIARMDKVNPPMDIRLGAQNLVFYMVDGDPRHSDTVAMVRQHTRPFMSQPNGEITNEDLVFLCRMHEVPVFFERSHSSLGELFNGNKHFCRLGIFRNPNGSPEGFTLEGAS